MRIADWLEAVDRGDPGAWSELLDAAVRIATALGAKDPEDVASTFVLQQVEGRARDARRASPSTDLAAWLGGCIRHRIQREMRGRRPVRRLPDVAARPPAPLGEDASCAEVSEDEVRRREFERRAHDRLTPAEAEALELHLSGLGSRAGAERLGISRDSFRDRLSAARRKLAAESAPRQWACDVARSFRLQGDEQMLWILTCYGRGAALSDIAEGTGLSYATVRDRIARVRAKVGTRVRRSPRRVARTVRGTAAAQPRQADVAA